MFTGGDFMRTICGSLASAVCYPLQFDYVCASPFILTIITVLFHHSHDYDEDYSPGKTMPKRNCPFVVWRLGNNLSPSEKHVLRANAIAYIESTTGLRWTALV